MNLRKALLCKEIWAFCFVSFFSWNYLFRGLPRREFSALGYEQPMSSNIEQNSASPVLWPPSASGLLVLMAFYGNLSLKPPSVPQFPRESL